MTHLVIFGLVTAVAVVNFWAGFVVSKDLSDRRHKRELQRAVRPAHITIEQRLTVHEYITARPEDLDLDFPKAAEVRNDREFV